MKTELPKYYTVMANLSLTKCATIVDLISFIVIVGELDYVYEQIGQSTKNITLKNMNVNLHT